MYLIRSPRRGWCMPTAFAMCVGCTPEAIVELIGHDGHEVIAPDLEEPSCYRGFHDQELVLALLDMGYSTTMIECNPQMIVLDSKTVDVFPDDSRFWTALYNCRQGVIMGSGLHGILHAVAWDGNQIYDPAGTIYRVEQAPEFHFSDWERLLRIDSIV